MMGGKNIIYMLQKYISRGALAFECTGRINVAFILTK